MHRRIDISHKTVFFITGFLIALWLLFLIKDIILLLFVAIILMSALSPIVNSLVAAKVPRALAIALVYVALFGGIFGLMSLVVAPLINETVSLAHSMPQTLQHLLPNTYFDQSIIQQQLTDFSRNALQFSFIIFSNFLSLASVAVLTFYLLLDRDKLDNLVAQFFIGKEDKVKKIISKTEEMLGAWLRGQIILSLVIGVLVYIVLFAFNIPYALPLAIFAAFMEVIPVLGPLISAIPGVLLALVQSPILALIVAASYLVIQQLEGHIIVPQVMKKAVGLNPLVVILAVAIGGRLLGIAGALLAVPIAVVIQIITEEVLKEEDILSE